MKEVLLCSEMQQADKNTIEHFKVPSLVLMERAAYSVFERVTDHFKDYTDFSSLVLVGPGNNGGDGFVLARLLFLKGYKVKILFIADRNRCSEQCKAQLDIVEQYGIEIVDHFPDEKFDMIADALFGIGLKREITGAYAEIINNANKADSYKIAVDIPSGINTDSGKVLGTAFKADVTYTFGFLKQGHLLYPGTDFCGEVVVNDIGIDRFSLLDIVPSVFVPEIEDGAKELPLRVGRTNKGNFGKVSIISGCETMPGAVSLCAKAAYRCGSGIVRVFTHESNKLIVASHVPEAIIDCFKDSLDEKKLDEIFNWSDSVVIGPGLGKSELSVCLVEYTLRNCVKPIVIDADGLNIIADNKKLLELLDGRCIVTPHLMEMSRLSGNSLESIKDDMFLAAGTFSSEHDCVTVLKDARSVTATPDGRRYINIYGNSGMSTGGSGDVLSGIIGAFAGMKIKADKAAYLGVMIHALSGDEMCMSSNKASLMAMDIADGVVKVLDRIEVLQNGQ